MISARSTLRAALRAFGFMLALAGPARAQMDENALFGGSPAADAGAVVDAGPAGDADASTQPTGDAPLPADAGPTDTHDATPAAAADSSHPEEAAAFGGKEDAPTTQKAAELAPQNPLTIGGTLFLSAQTSAYSHQLAKNWVWDMPNLLDVYLDARPNSRVRALAAGRLTYDPTLDESLIRSDGTHASQVNAYLDQLWISFDIARSVFLTLGKQHVKWGTGHIWNPTDFLQPVKFNPTAIFDQRLGVTLAKVQIPWEARGWNFYGYGVFQNGESVDTVGQIGGALRAEIVLGPAEFGIEGLAQQGREARVGADVSSGLGPFDVYAEAAVHRADGPRVILGSGGDGGLVAGSNGTASYESAADAQAQVTLGGNWQVNITDRDALTLGLEGLYNGGGYTSSSVYPAIILANAFTPFYVAKYYGALYVTVALPRGQTTHTFSFLTAGNLDDRSFLSRLDYNVRILTHITLDFYGDVHYGDAGGEFRFGISPAAIYGGGQILPTDVMPNALFDVGAALRVSL